MPFISSKNINGSYFDMHEDNELFMNVVVHYANICMPDTKVGTINYGFEFLRVRRFYLIL